MKNYDNISTGYHFPKTLFIRNQIGGLIWQVYNVHSYNEAEYLSTNAKRNGFEGRTLTDYDSNYEETFENWREHEGFIKGFREFEKNLNNEK